MKKITIKDIAELTGYNVSTISRSLNDNERIPLETREKIKQIAKELNYTVNLNARNLSQKRSNNIGVFMQNDFFSPPSSAFTNPFWNVLNEVIQDAGYEPVLYLFGSMENLEEKASKLLESSLIDGVILFSKNLTDDVIDFFEKRKYPYVLLYYGPEKYREKIFGTDNFLGGKIITEHLIERELKKIATITSDITPSFSERTEGYRCALKESGIEIEESLIFNSPFPSVKCGEEIAKIISKKLDKVDAVFAQHDEWSFGLLKGFSALGIKIPEEISIIGHDNLYYKEWFTPILTTFTIERREICENAVRYLIDERILKKEQVPIKKILGKIVQGDTVRKK